VTGNGLVFDSGRHLVQQVLLRRRLVVFNHSNHYCSIFFREYVQSLRGPVEGELCSSCFFLILLLSTTAFRDALAGRRFTGVRFTGVRWPHFGRRSAFSALRLRSPEDPGDRMPTTPSVLAANNLGVPERPKLFHGREHGAPALVRTFTRKIGRGHPEARRVAEQPNRNTARPEREPLISRKLDRN